MGNSAVKDDRTYTYEDYLTWPEDQRWEIIDGVAYAMTAPNRLHQDISRNLMVEFGNYLRGKQCKVYAAPFDVRLPHKEETENNSSSIVKPDITVVCDPNKLDPRGCKGSPDLIIEILSPATASYDVVKKRRLYEQNGIIEYWIVDPLHQIITRLYMNEALTKYRESEYFGREDMISPIILSELTINLSDVFPKLEEPIC